MHPVLNNRTWLAVWLAAWLGAGGILALIAREAAPSFALAGILALLCITPYWLCRALPLNSTSTLKLGMAHVADGLLIAFAAVYAAGFASTGENWPEVRFAMIGVAFVLDMLAVAAYYAGLGMEASQRAELAIREAQLKALKSQVNPHFLFQQPEFDQRADVGRIRQRARRDVYCGWRIFCGRRCGWASG